MAGYLTWIPTNLIGNTILFAHVGRMGMKNCDLISIHINIPIELDVLI